MMRASRLRVFIIAAMFATGLAVLAPAGVSISNFPSAARQTANASVAPCSSDGTGCSVGSVGPGGGVIFYDAGSTQWWGRFLEAKTNSVPAAGVWGSAIINPRVAIKEIGMGKANSKLMLQDSISVYSRLQSYFGSGVNEFYLPSKDELDALYNYWKISGDQRLKYSAAPMWTSSQASATFVWYQLFQDGTQFTDANGIIRGLQGNKDYLKSPVHAGSDFKATDFQVVGVRAIPATSNLQSDIDLTVRATTNNSQCSAGGANTVCKVGDIGPGGGIVFYDAGKDEYWGRYLEMAPKSCEGERLSWRPAGNTKTVYTGSGSQSAAELRLLAKGLGMGKVNTRVITLALGAGTKPYAAKFAEDSTCGGKDDWFLPSKDELDIAFNRLAQNRVAGNDTPVGGFNKGYYWTSTDYNNSTAWTQYFIDGQQFDRVQTLDGNKNPPTPFRVRPIRAFGTNNVVLACKDGGPCKVGDTGPGGGTVFYVAPSLLIKGKTQWRYLEVQKYPLFQADLCARNTNTRNVQTIDGLGEGRRNSEKLLVGCIENIHQIEPKNSWYVPSISELELALNQLGNPEGGFWTSNLVFGQSIYFGCKSNTCQKIGASRGNAYFWLLVRAFK
ncbi:MAG: DUF1566 domain-containing protein [Actinobacteria bacterium]|nr:DUF1566 domain-containing protein [Actinomycetota bacterium]